MFHNFSLVIAHTEIDRRLADAEQRRRARSCRTGRPIRTVLARPSSQP